MAKMRSRRAASPAQLAARARFSAMVKSGAFKKKAKKRANPKKAAKKKAKRAKKKAARRNPHHYGHGMHHMRRNEAAPKAKAAKKAAPKRSRAKKAPVAVAETAAETAAFQKEARQGERAERAASMTPAQKAARRRLRELRKANAKKISAVRQSLKKTRAALKAIPKGKRAAKGEKVGKRSAKRRILKTKKDALNLTYSALIGSMAPAERNMLKAAGLMRANPGIGEVFSSLASLAPQLGAHAVGLAGAAVAGQKIGDMIAKRAPASMPGRAFIEKHAVTIGTIGVAVAAYEALKHASPKTRPFAGAALMGGLAAAFVHAAARMPQAKAIGLPIGPMAPAAPAPTPAAMAGYIDVDGTALAVDGMGEYMALSGSTLTGSSLGEYMALSGSTLTGSSLGEIGQMSEGRQGARALNSPGDVPVEDFFEDDEDEGSLSGSIFDD